MHIYIYAAKARLCSENKVLNIVNVELKQSKFHLFLHCVSHTPTTTIIFTQVRRTVGFVIHKF